MPVESTYSVYLVRVLATGALYGGIATDVAARFEKHASGRGAKYLRGKGALRLEFQQAIGGRSAASRVEYHLKRLPKARKEALVRGEVDLKELMFERGVAW